MKHKVVKRGNKYRLKRVFDAEDWITLVILGMIILLVFVQVLRG